MKVPKKSPILWGIFGVRWADLKLLVHGSAAHARGSFWLFFWYFADESTHGDGGGGNGDGVLDSFASYASGVDDA